MFAKGGFDNDDTKHALQKVFISLFAMVQSFTFEKRIKTHRQIQFTLRKNQKQGILFVLENHHLYIIYRRPDSGFRSLKTS